MNHALTIAAVILGLCAMTAAHRALNRADDSDRRAAKADRANIQREVQSALAEKMKAESDWQSDFDARKLGKTSKAD